MVRSIRGYRLLQGFRGRTPGNIAAVEDLLLRVSRWVEGLPEVVELDLNPIFVLPPGKARIAGSSMRAFASPNRDPVAIAKLARVSF
jgi:acyl-CoA synthetase (NDP forming)